jgi:predicted nucleic acid-binding protein
MNLKGRVFLDTAILIYYVERREPYLTPLVSVFEQVDRGVLEAVTSPVTLAECLVLPYRENRLEIAQRFFECIVNARNTTCVPLDPETARKAAELRAKYNLLLSDAFQLATCLSCGCDAFLTNDLELKKVQEVNVVTVGEIG